MGHPRVRRVSGCDLPTRRAPSGRDPAPSPPCLQYSRNSRSNSADPSPKRPRIEIRNFSEESLDFDFPNESPQGTQPLMSFENFVDISIFLDGPEETALDEQIRAPTQLYTTAPRGRPDRLGFSGPSLQPKSSAHVPEPEPTQLIIPILNLNPPLDSLKIAMEFARGIRDAKLILVLRPWSV